MKEIISGIILLFIAGVGLGLGYSVGASKLECTLSDYEIKTSVQHWGGFDNGQIRYECKIMKHPETQEKIKESDNGK